ncbi:cytochrome P450 [Cyathus striatus]|nr:cytochrome P450 [Cyathus striatus]
MILTYIVVFSIITAVHLYRIARRKNVASTFHKPLPDTVESFLPWVGSGLRYLQQPDRFLKECRESYGPIYKFFAFGRNVVILSTPSSIAKFLQTSPQALDVINFQMNGPIAGLPNDSRMPFIYSIIDQKALPMLARGLSRRTFQDVSRTFNSLLFASLLKQADVPVRLRDFVQRLMFRCNAVAFFGHHFPLDIFEDFIIYDDNLPYLLAKIPFLSKKSKISRDRMVVSLATYFARAWNDDHGGYLEGASDVISNVTRELILSGMSTDEIPHVLLGFLWGMSTNHIRTAFWVLAHILTDPSAFVTIRDEVRGALDDRVFDINTFLAIDDEYWNGPHFLKITSAIMETLRLVSLPAPFREAVRDHVLSTEEGYIFIKKGEYVIADVRGMHFDKCHFDNAGYFKFDRFLKEDNINTLQSGPPTFSAFGGGNHMCKGKYFALQTIKMIVILCFHMFDMEIQSVDKSPTSLPQVTTRMSFTPVAPCDSGKGLHISLRRRETFKDQVISGS